MAIISEQNNNNKMEQTSFADKKDLPISFRSIETPLDEICKCIVGRCTYTNMVFGDQFSEVEYKNDFTGFIVVSSGYAGLTQLNPIFYLVKSDGSEVEIDTSLFNPPYKAERVLDSFNNLVGFKIQWRNILIDEGAGKYSFRFEINDFGFVREIYSIDYQLYDFNEAIARDTIKLTWRQNGYVENFDEGVDFTELSFENSLRIGGKVNYLADTLENDEYEDVGRNRIQIQSKVKNNYELVTHLIPKQLGDILIKDMTLANTINITTYNRETYDHLVNRQVKVVEISDFKGNYNSNNTGTFTFKLENIQQSYIKRNVRL